MDRKDFYALVESHYKEHFDSAVNKLSNYLGNRVTAEDVVQDAYTNALTYYKTFNPFEEKEAVNQYTKEFYDKQVRWAFNKGFRTVTNNAIRANFKKEIAHGMVDDSVLIRETAEEGMLRPFFERIVLNRLLEKIAAQPDRIKKILSMYLVDGYSAQEVELVVPESAVNIRKIAQRFRDDIKVQG